MKTVTRSASLILMIAILLIVSQLLEPAAGDEIWMAGLQVQRQDGVPACRCPEPIWIADCGCVVLD